MPKKTREEKMAAAIRRLKQQVSLQQNPTQPRPESASSPAPTPPPPTLPAQQPVSPQDYSVAGLKLKTVPTAPPVTKEEERYNYTYVAADLRKIAILASAAAALEIILNLTTRASFAKLILRAFGIEI